MELKTVFIDFEGVFVSLGIVPYRVQKADIQAIAGLIAQGIEVHIVTGSKSQDIATLLEPAGVTSFFLGSYDKADMVRSHMAAYQLEAKNCAYFGDGPNDLDAMKLVGLSACPWDAHPQVKELVKFSTDTKGGEGCVAEFIEKIRPFLPPQ